jgi:hypothetical protein
LFPKDFAPPVFADITDFKSAFWENSGVTTQFKKVRALIDAFERVERCLEEIHLLELESKFLHRRYVEDSQTLIHYKTQITNDDRKSRAIRAQIGRQIQRLYRLQSLVKVHPVTAMTMDSIEIGSNITKR